MCSDSLAGLPARGSALQVSVDNIVLASIEGSKTVMRHSTTRIAYSTVDTGKPKVFSYVAVVKNTQLVRLPWQLGQNYATPDRPTLGFWTPPSPRPRPLSLCPFPPSAPTHVPMLDVFISTSNTCAKFGCAYRCVAKF